MHKIFISLLIIIFSAPVFASKTIVRQNPYYMNHHSPYYNNYYAQERRFREPYYPHNVYQKPSILKNIRNYFSGQLTGFTPDIEDSFFSPSTYGNRRYSTYSSPWGNGYKYSDYGSGSSSGVRILD